MRIVTELRDRKSAAAWMADLELRREEWLEFQELGVFETVGRDLFHTRFVGWISTGRDLIAFQPKYAGATTLPREAWTVLVDAFRRYRANPQFTAVQEHEVNELWFGDDAAFGDMELFVKLSDYFNRFGPYRVERRLIGSARGRTHWPATIARTTPIYSETGTFYPQPVRSARAGSANLVTDIQISVLHELEANLAPIINRVLPEDVSVAHAVIEPHALAENAAYWSSILRLELARIFRTDTINMVRWLLEYLDRKRSSIVGRRPLLLGTTAFYRIWEEACRHNLISHGRAMGIEELSQPRWNLAGTIIPGGPQRPDLLLATGGGVVVVDAKYYRFPFGNDEAKPGWNDIVKQLFYAESVGSRAKIDCNLFLLPQISETPAVVGRVEMQHGGAFDPNFKPIAVATLDPSRILSGYVHGRNLTAEDWRRLLEDARRVMTEAVQTQ